ncbi:MAG: DUF433 domain-containing protein [Acidobacteria bacterium]|nr:DUF433 domain-containing protein [Acidobacteriota bacterium]
MAHARSHGRRPRPRRCPLPTLASVGIYEDAALERRAGERYAQHRSVVHSDPDILGGTPVFQGTRVPFRNLIDYLERNYSVDEFLDAFPSVSRSQVVSALEAAHETLSGSARPSR